MLKAIPFRNLIEEKGKLDACRAVRPEIASEDQANAFIWQYVNLLLGRKRYAAAGIVLWGESTFNARPECVRQVWNSISKHPKNGIIGCGAASKSYTGIVWHLLDWAADPLYTSVKLVSTTAGHCFAPGTLVRMHDGSNKPVEKIRPGDRVMGPDSKPRRVIETHSGEDEMYHIKPLRTAGFVCNGRHMLHLEQSINSPDRWKKLGEQRDVSVEDYIDSSETFKREFKMARQGFELPEIKQEFDPYITGLWLGDGHTGCPALTTMDQPIKDHWCGYFEDLGYSIKTYSKKDNKASTYYARKSARGDKGVTGQGVRSNPFTEFIQTKCHDGLGKRIPESILRSCRAHRLQCLAGLMDSDGTNNQNGYLISTKFQGLRDDILNLCSSLGFHASERKITIKGRNYWSICIRGNCEDTPVLLERKKCKPTQTRQRPIGFRVTAFGRGRYFGFELDGDHLFILSSGIVARYSKANTYSTMVRLWKSAVVPLPGLPISNYLGLDATEKKSGISVVAIPQGDDGRGRLKGFHPDPRPQPHPIFGPTMRIRIHLDECEDVPIGVWEGVDNVLLSMDGTDRVKVTLALNPKDPTSKVAQILEPEGGWGEFDIDTGVKGKDTWTSKENWFVCRLDGKKMENVKQRREVFPGFLTYEGYRGLETKSGGNTPEYYSQARGCYPPEGVNSAILTQGILGRCRGDFLFVGRPINIGGVDIAVDGRDLCIFTKGRAGMATGFRHRSGQLVRFQTPRMVVQADQQFECRKGDTKIVGDDLIKNALALHISPEYLCIDSTGNGSAVWAYVCAQWGAIQGLDFNKEATKIKILTEDKRTPEELYDGVVTEVWYALRFWAEFGYFAIAPGIRQNPLEPELLGRRYVLGLGKMIKVEKKDDYKKRLGHSPDFADSMTIMLHGARMREAIFASMMGNTEPKKQQPPQHGVIDSVEWFAG